MPYCIEVQPNINSMYLIAKDLWDKFGVDYHFTFDYIAAKYDSGEKPKRTRKLTTTDSKGRAQIGVVISSIRLRFAIDSERKKLYLNNIDIPPQLLKDREQNP